MLHSPVPLCSTECPPYGLSEVSPGYCLSTLYLPVLGVSLKSKSGVGVRIQFELCEFCFERDEFVGDGGRGVSRSAPGEGRRGHIASRGGKWDGVFSGHVQ